MLLPSNRPILSTMTPPTAEAAAPDAIGRQLSLLLVLNLRSRGAETSHGDRAPGLRVQPACCVARDGRLVTFAAPEAIRPFLYKCVEQWLGSTTERPSPRDVAAAAARFWLTFVAVHPFVDGNGRTAKAFLRMELEPLGFAISGFELIDRYLIEGKAGDLENLAALFLMSIKTSPSGGNA